MREPVVVADRISYRVGDAELVRMVDFVARRGEVVAVLGPNGAGKSTLLGLLGGDLIPGEGQVLIDGIDTRGRVPGDLARVRSVLTQRAPTEIPFTVAAVVEMGRFPYRRDPGASREGDAAAIRSAMDRTDTAQFAGRVFATLSAGEQTRVSLARVLAQDTPLVLLDEPTTALDVAHQERVHGEMRRLAKDGRSIVVVLHDLNAAAHYADRLVLMADGGIRATGSARAVLDADLLSEVYGQPMAVMDHPLRECPLVLVADTPPTPEA